MYTEIHCPLQVFVYLMVSQKFLAAFLKTYFNKGSKFYTVVKADLFFIKKKIPKQFIINL